MIEIERIRAVPISRLALPIAACGGGMDADPSSAPSASAPSRRAATLDLAATTVSLQGRVVTPDWSGVPGAVVHVRTAQGRLLGSALTDSRGVFALTVPARADIVVDTSFAGPGGLELKTGSTALSVAGCLIEVQ